MSHPRLDMELVARGICDTRSRAKALIMAGDVLVNDQRETRAGRQIAPTDLIALKQKPRFVSRGGEKLAGALEEFHIDISGMIAADFGASTGGFTDCLLQAGAERVYAIDVGYGILDDRIRRDERVVVIERTNARYLEALPEPIDIIVMDVSFISLRLMFPAARKVLRQGGMCVPLIKPQFEAGPEHIGKRGVVRDHAIHEQVLHDVTDYARENGFTTLDLTLSSLKGPNGNIEFLGYFTTDSALVAPPTGELISRVMGTVGS